LKLRKSKKYGGWVGKTNHLHVLIGQSPTNGNKYYYQLNNWDDMDYHYNSYWDKQFFDSLEQCAIHAESHALKVRKLWLITSLVE
jgi:hypothetical protein